MERHKYKWTENSTKFTWDVIMFDIDDDYAQVIIKSEPEMPLEEVKLSDGVLRQCIGIKGIYEGDVVKDCKGDYFEVRWNKEALMFEGLCIKETHRCGEIGTTTGLYAGLKVVGDIYEA